MKVLPPKISIIIPTFNNELTLEKTLKSIFDQEYNLKELIIIDGGSKDNTLSIIKKYQKRLSYWISQKDRGIADAFNKGTKVATGDYLFFLGAGDTFCNSEVLKNIMKDVEPGNDLLISGQINRVNKNGQILYTTRNNFKKEQLLYKMAIPHQGLFTHRKFFEKYGLFDINCKYAMDYDILLRAYSDFPKIAQKNLVVANWMEGGIGQNNTIKVLTEYHKIRLKNKIAPKWLLNVLYLISKWRYGIYK